MKIETIKLWGNREDVELTTFLHVQDPFLPKKSRKPALIAVPGGAYQTCPRHGNGMSIRIKLQYAVSRRGHICAVCMQLPGRMDS